MNETKAVPDAGARRRAVGETDRTLIVEAGAGTGKTTLMATRVALVLAAGADPGTVAAITFTELAAGSLKARVRALVEGLARGEAPPELAALDAAPDARGRAALARAAPALETMICTTIHGLCRTLLERAGTPAHWRPGTAVAEPLEAERLRARAHRSAITAALARDDATATLLATLMAHDAAGTEALIAEIAHAGGDGDGGAPQDRHALAGAAATFASAAGALAASARSGGFAEAGTEETGASAEALARALARESARGAPGALAIVRTRPPSTLATASGTWRAYRRKGKWAAAAKAAGATKGEGEAAFARAGEAYAACAEAFEALRAAGAQALRAPLAALGRAGAAAYREEKRRAGVADFDDLVEGARAMLAGDACAREAVRAQVRTVLVDEFQDTDAAQTEIVWRIAALDDPPDWRDARLRPGALFAVGDPKQAIYGFRGADVATYTEAKARLEAADAGACVEVTTNFRCRPGVIDWVNTRFAGPLGEAGQPGWTPLAAGRDAGAPRARVERLDIAPAPGRERGTAGEQREREAEAVAALCAERLEARAEGARHPGEMALLAPAGSGLWRYEDALERAGVPVASQAGKGFFAREEVKGCIAAMRCIADPNDAVALAALLRGPAVGLTDETLLDIAAALGAAESPACATRALTLGADPEALAPWPVAREVVETLAALGRRAHRAPPHTLLVEAVERLSMRAVVAARPGSPERGLANVDALIERARGYALEGTAAFARDLHRAWALGARVAEAVPDNTGACVSVRTMHAAKGLEWPTVVVVNTAARPRTERPRALRGSDARATFAIGGAACEGYEAAVEARQAERARERVRLWYVAATRARERLVLVADAGASEQSWARVLDLELDALPAAREGGRRREVTSARGAPGTPRGRRPRRQETLAAKGCSAFFWARTSWTVGVPATARSMASLVAW